jgi:hypothetical protein
MFQLWVILCLQIYQFHLQGIFLMKITIWTALFKKNTRLSQWNISTTIRTFIPNIYACRKIFINFNTTFCVLLWYLCIYPFENCAHFWWFTLHLFWGTVDLSLLLWCQWTTCKLGNIYKDIILYENVRNCFICFMWRQAVQHLLLFQFAISHGPHVSLQCNAASIVGQSHIR